jgi:tetratricopeptide (TPR) repeat protein
MCQLAINAVDSILYQGLLKVMGDIYMHDFKSYNKALECFEKLRSLASFKDEKFKVNLIQRGIKGTFDKFYDKDLKLYAYQHMGKAYQCMKEYDLAIACFKK